ncbi:MAG: LytTR family DNA-binding domain-containing protein [Balneolaceae bacterium]|nr:LytTR family DNA-binding domain-containing protein [Balneolaceae bacterium]
MQLNRDIPFTASWRHTLLIGLGLSLLIIFIQVFLQPFDTFLSDTAFKSLKLSGYGLTVFVPIILLHFPEVAVYNRQGQKWYVINEIITVAVGFSCVALLGYVYHGMVFNAMNVGFSHAMNWMVFYALPFAPLFIPLWAYLRYRFSQITIDHEELSDETVTIQGQNANETLTFEWSDFVLATVDSNYLDIYVLNEEGDVEKHVIRGTLSGLVDQLPKARQIHRSYLVNTAYIKELSGNSRKGAAILKHYPDEVPVSPKHFSALRSYLQSRP